MDSNKAQMEGTMVMLRSILLQRIELVNQEATATAEQRVAAAISELQHQLKDCQITIKHLRDDLQAATALGGAQAQVDAANMALEEERKHVKKVEGCLRQAIAVANKSQLDAELQEAAAQQHINDHKRKDKLIEELTAEKERHQAELASERATALLIREEDAKDAKASAKELELVKKRVGLVGKNADVTAYMKRTAPERLAADAKAAAEAKLQKQHIKALEEELRVIKDHQTKQNDCLLTSAQEVAKLKKALATTTGKAEAAKREREAEVKRLEAENAATLKEAFKTVDEKSAAMAAMEKELQELTKSKAEAEAVKKQQKALQAPKAPYPAEGAHPPKGPVPTQSPHPFPTASPTAKVNSPNTPTKLSQAQQQTSPASSSDTGSGERQLPVQSNSGVGGRGNTGGGGGNSVSGDGVSGGVGNRGGGGGGSRGGGGGGNRVGSGGNGGNSGGGGRGAGGGRGGGGGQGRQGSRRVPGRVLEVPRGAAPDHATVNSTTRAANQSRNGGGTRRNDGRHHQQGPQRNQGHQSCSTGNRTTY